MKTGNIKVFIFHYNYKFSFK